MSSQELLQTALFSNLRKLINIIDDLRDIGLQQYIKLPRIAVVGTQSAGKSSLLENVVGLDFLPRGSGVVTRRPLELRLVHEPESRGKIQPWAIFDEIKDQKFTDFDLVRQKIEELTDRIAGANKGIVDNPIKLTIHSNESPDLTIIDLPGITRISIKDQMDIEQVTKGMASRYISDERTIILAVLAANQDMTTSDGLKLAMDIDKGGQRTIGCITKIDIMDSGTNAKSMLMGMDVPLKLGFVGIKNRSQQDIINKVKVQQALVMERDFFRKHPIYSTMDPQYLGTQALVSKLTTVLFHHIRNCLPDIVIEIKKQIKTCEEKLNELGPPLPQTNLEKQQLILNMIIDFTENFKNQLTGKYDSRRESELSEDLNGGAAIKMFFNKLYQEFTSSDFKATKEYKDSDIDRAITLHQGDSIPGFPSIDAFLYLINPQLEKLKEPALETLSDVFNFLENLANRIIKKIFARFPPVMEEVSELSSHILIEQREKAKSLVLQIIQSEQEFLYTNDIAYLQKKTKFIPVKNEQHPVNEKEVDPQKVFLDELRNRVDAYYQIVIRNVRDTIPKAIGYFLVRQSQDQLQYKIYNEITKKQDMELLNEPSHIKEERQTVTKTLSVLKNAMKLLKKDPDLAPYLVKAEKLEKQQEEQERNQQRATISAGQPTQPQQKPQQFASQIQPQQQQNPNPNQQPVKQQTQPSNTGNQPGAKNPNKKADTSLFGSNK